MARLTQDQWRALIDEQAASGKTAIAFCGERGINNKYFSTRKSQLSKPSATGGFVAVTTKALENQHIQLCIGDTQLRIVIGRKNWHFSNTASGAKASAILYSIIETAKANGLNPVRYVELLLMEIPRRNSGDDLENLMPWVVKLGVDD